MIKRYPKIYGTTKSRIENIFKYFSEYSISADNVRKIIINAPELLGFKIKTVEEKIKFLNEIGYSIDDIVFILERNSLILYKNKESFLKTIKYFTQYLDIKTILKMIKNNPVLIINKISTIETKKKYFINLGYTEQDYFKLLSITMIPKI